MSPSRKFVSASENGVPMKPSRVTPRLLVDQTLSTNSLSYVSDLYQDTLSYNHNSDEDSDVPNVNERLAYLQPSTQLLEFYRKKIADYDGENESLLKKLEQHKKAYDVQYASEWEMRHREEEIAELQKALSDTQVSLFQEREHVLRLFAENDRYKIQDLQGRRSILKLLEKTGRDTNEVGGKHVLPSGTLTESVGDKRSISREQPSSEGDITSLTQQIKLLQGRLEQCVRDAKGKLQVMLQERQNMTEQYEHVREKDMDKIKTVTEKLHETQELLYLSTQDMLHLRQGSRNSERKWMMDKDRLLQELDSVKEQLSREQPDQQSQRHAILNVSNTASDLALRQKQELAKLREDIDGSHKMAEMYREQLVELEDELARLREKDDLRQDTFQEKTTNMSKRYELMKKRFEDLEKRRNLEVEGYHNDIKVLRRRLKDMEQQLYKVTVGAGDFDLLDSRSPDVDLDVLKNIHLTASRSKKMNDALKGLKVKLNHMETDGLSRQ